MSENPIAISNINDFIFCPVSIYFHALDLDTEKLMYQCEDQLNGSAAHEKTDNGEYSDRTDILQAVSVYCEEYSLFGKIDVFDVKNGVLTERKRSIKTVYDGYVFQLYAQYFALIEMGYNVNEIKLYSMQDNKTYKIPLPNEDKEMFFKFKNTIKQMKSFAFENFEQKNAEKCKRCIYEEMCYYSKA